MTNIHLLYSRPIGEDVRWTGDKQHLMATLEQAITSLATEGHRPAWE